MLNIGFNLDIDIKQTKYPIYFEKNNICVHCGSEGQLTFVDKFGNETKREIHPFDHIKCKSCGRHFSILWQTDSNTGRMYPCAVDPSFKQEFINIINNKNIKQKGDNIL